MQSRDWPSGEENVCGDSRAGAGYAREIGFAHPGLFRERAESRGLSLLSDNGGDEAYAHCRSDRPRPAKRHGHAGVARIRDARGLLQRAFGRAGLEDRAVLLAGLRLRNVYLRTSRLDALGRELGRWRARDYRSGELELGERY